MASSGYRGRPANGGLAIDTWHMGKLRIAPEDLKRIPGEYLAWVELSDGPVEYMPDPIDEVINHRRLPGEGEFDIPGYIEACQAVGYDGPWGVEILSEELRNLPIEEEFKRAYETTAAQFRAGVTCGSGPLGGTMDQLDNDRLVWMFTQMLRIREFEERVKRTFEEHPGVIRGHTHLADGAEASIVGSLATMKPGDQLMATYRCHGYPIALGTDTKSIMAEIYGRKDGLCGGYGGSMHLIDPGRGFLGTSGIVGQGIPQATGVAFAAQLRKQGQVVLSFFGDGASKQGAFHESLNLASLWKLPVVYVMENNNYNVSTRSEQEDANAANGEPLSVKAAAYSMPGVTVDGGDPVAVYEVVGAAADRARAGDGPTLVESKVYRLSAHGNIIAPPGVPLHYPEHEAITTFGNREEYEAALRGDPVPRFRARLVEQGVLDPARADEIAKEVTEEMDGAVQFALDSPFPEPEAAARNDYVYA